MTGRTRRFITSAVAAALTVSLAACGGSGGGSNTLPSTGNPQTPVSNHKNATASMVITIPRKTTTSIVNPKYISASTKSMTIAISGSTAAPQEVDLTPTSPNCTPTTGGGTQCTVNVVADAGAQTFVLKMYDQTGGKGNVLSTGNVAATLTAGQSTNVPIVLDGVAATLSVALGTATLPVGNAGSTTVTVMAQDADKNYIVGPGAFSSPITLALSGDTHKTLSLSATSVTSPGQVVTLGYNGGSNVGSTITATSGSLTPATATFNGTGTSLTQMSWNDTADNFSYSYPYSVQAVANGDAVVEVWASWINCCWQALTFLDVASPDGTQKVYGGDVTDFYNPPAAGSLTYNGPVTVVHGMSKAIATWWGGQNRSLALSSDGGSVYYAASEKSLNDPNCPGGYTSYFGAIGKFNPASPSTVSEKALKGVPLYLQTDPSGNVWFVESAGTCNGTSYFTSGYAVGELKADGTVTETDLTSTGFSGSYPSAMALSPDGSQMYIADYYNDGIFKVATATLSGGTIMKPANSAGPYGVATAPDGTLFWQSDTVPDQNYYYGYLPANKAFDAANAVTNMWPIQAFFAYDMSYGDGSMWFGGDYTGGIARFTSGTSGSTPMVNYYQFPEPYGDYQETDGISNNGGYTWATDDEYDQIDAVQYGAPTSVMMTQAKVRTAATVLRPMTTGTPGHVLNHDHYGKTITLTAHVRRTH